jgi:hypothetical protein
MRTRRRPAPWLGGPWVRELWLAGFLALASTSHAGDDPVNLGVPVDESELRPWSITIFPSGRGLPQGRGSVAAGERLYGGLCAQCHGRTGSEGPAARLAGPDGFVHPDHGALLSMSVGARWPYATSIFDYVRRAMPHTAPKSLTNDQVYALTAYILRLNDLVASDFILSAENLPAIVMPARSLAAEHKPLAE